MPRNTSEPLIVIRNPNSTNADSFDELRFDLNKNDITFSEYATESGETEENIAAMQQRLPEHKATVISAAGDGTAMQLLSAILRSRKQRSITTGFVNYGGFGDIPHAHNDMRSTIMDILGAPVAERYPLTIDVNGEYWRDAPAYATLGLTALAAMRFDTPESRRLMKRGPRFLKRPKSMLQLGRSYFEHRNTFLPPFRLDDEEQVYSRSTDVFVANNPYIGGVIRLPDNHYDTLSFGRRADMDFSHIVPNIPFGVKAIAGHAPFDRTTTMRLVFEHAADVPIQTEGETMFLNGAHEIFVYKDPSKALRVLNPRTRQG